MYNPILFVINSNGDVVKKSGIVRAINGYREYAVVITPLSNTAVSMSIMTDNGTFDKKEQYVLPTNLKVSDFVSSDDPLYQSIYDWNVYGVEIKEIALESIALFRTGSTTVTFQFQRIKASDKCIAYKGYFGIDLPLPQTAEIGDYYECQEYNYTIVSGTNNYTFTKGMYAYFNGVRWVKDRLLVELNTPTVEIAVEPSHATGYQLDDDDVNYLLPLGDNIVEALQKAELALQKIEDIKSGLEPLDELTLKDEQGNEMNVTFDGKDPIINYRGVSAEVFKNLFLEVEPAVGVTFTNGMQVMYAGSIGGSGKRLAKPTNLVELKENPNLYLGTITQITEDNHGIVNWYGVVNHINTSGQTLGAPVYVGNNGSWTTIKPISPLPIITIGLIERVNNSQGQISVRPNVGNYLNQLHDVYTNGHTFVGGETIMFNLANGRYEVYDLAGKLQQLDDDINLLNSNKVDKILTIIGLDLQNNISLEEFKVALGNVTQIVAGLMSPEDKTHLDNIVDLFNEDGDDIVNTIAEILAVFQNFPEGATILEVLATKVDKVAGKQLSTNDLTNTLKNYYDIAHAHSQIVNSNPHQTTYQQLLNKPTTIEQLGVTNVYNKQYVDTQDQILDDRIDNIIAGTVEGVSGAEIVDARGSYTVLGDRLDVLSNGAAHFERYVIESRDKAHFSGFPYTSFGGGCTFNGMELYAQRSGKFHSSTSDQNDWGVLVMYRRLEGGSFSPAIVDLPYSTLDGEARDVNLSVSPDGKYLYMKFFTNAGTTGVYSGYLVVYDRTMAQVGMIKIVDNADWVVWGNTLKTPNGYLLTSSYTGVASPSKVGIYRSSSPVYDDYSSVTFTKVAEITQNDITESTLGYWRDKLVMVSRREYYSGNSLYYETSNLEGDSGWSSLENIGHIVYAPVIKPYNEEPVLLVSGTLRINSDLRQPMLLARKWQGGWTNPSVIDKEMEDYGGYTSLVPNRYGYGIMYYDNTTPRTTIYFKDVNVDTYLPEYKKWLMDSENYIFQEIENEIGAVENLITLSLNSPIPELNNRTLDEVFGGSLILNPDFENGTTSWGNSNSTFTVLDGIASIQASAQFGGPRQDITSIVGNRHYLKVRWKPSSTSQRIVHQQFSNQTYQPTSVGTWQDYTRIDTVTTNPGSEIRLTDNGSSGWILFEVDYCYVVDMTELGIANVSQLRMDYWLSVYRIKMWKGPTLVNSSTTYLKYRKDVLGDVVIEGNITVSTAGTNFTLPVGYRPLTTLVIGDFTFNTDGTVVSETGGLKYINTRFTGA